MKIHILYKISESALGGGNQFLKALKRQFLKMGVYENTPELAQVVLFNSHQYLMEVLKLKKKFPKIFFVHRVDGPIGGYRNNNFILDKIIYKFNNLIVDATVFQSNWSREQNKKFGMKTNRFETIITNAPDSALFNKFGKIKFENNRKIKLVMTSWSNNWNKGFEYYQYLDENLDFTKYEATFIGNSPIIFKNIKKIEPLPSRELAEKLKQYDIFITASKNDPCSNSVIEALHCGLPCVYLKSGGHSEIVGVAGEGFINKLEIISKIEMIIKNYDKYQQSINNPIIEEIGKYYFTFIEDINNYYIKNGLCHKSVSNFLVVKIILFYNFFLLVNRLKNLIKKYV